MEIKLSQISKRLFLRYYPAWFIIYSLTSFNLLKVLNWNWNPQESFAQNIIGGQIMFFFIYLSFILALHFFKPHKLIIRLITMISAMLLASLFLYVLTILGYRYSPAIVYRPDVPPQILHFCIISGSFAIWFFILAERSLIAERDLAREETARLSSEKTLIENSLKLLQAQMEPRFLFNTMKRIESLFDLDIQKAKFMQMHFVQYLRATLVKTRISTTTVDQEMELIHAYLDLLKVSLEDRLSYSIEIDPQVKDLPFPSMLIQPIIESSIRPEFTDRTKKSEITISLIRKNDMLEVRITNTGLNPAEKYRVEQDLSVVKERISSLFGDKGRISFENSLSSGLLMIIEVPYA